MALQGINIHPLRRTESSAAAGREHCGDAGAAETARHAGATGLPQRPDLSILSDAIPLFFIGRNNDGFWVARAADEKIGGLFLRKASALRFAKKNTEPSGFATMLVAEGFELDIENRGNPLAAHLGTAKRILLRFAPPLTVFAEKVPAPIMDAIRIWLALATVAALMWLLITVLTAIPQALSAHLIASPSYASATFMPPL